MHLPLCCFSRGDPHGKTLTRYKRWSTAEEATILHTANSLIFPSPFLQSSKQHVLSLHAFSRRPSHTSPPRLWPWNRRASTSQGSTSAICCFWVSVCVRNDAGSRQRGTNHIFFQFTIYQSNSNSAQFHSVQPSFSRNTPSQGDTGSRRYPLIHSQSPSFARW